MRILVVGDGKVGHTVAEQLTREGHDVVIIDKNEFCSGARIRWMCCASAATVRTHARCWMPA